MAAFRDMAQGSYYRGLAKTEYERILPNYIEDHLGKANSASFNGRCTDAKQQLQMVFDVDPQNQKTVELGKNPAPKSRVARRRRRKNPGGTRADGAKPTATSEVLQPRHATTRFARIAKIISSSTCTGRRIGTLDEYAIECTTRANCGGIHGWGWPVCSRSRNIET